MQKPFLVFCFSLATSFALSIGFLFGQADPFLAFFFPSSVFESPFSFVVRDPQQFVAVRVWGRVAVCFFGTLAWGGFAFCLYWSFAFSRCERDPNLIFRIWRIYVLCVAVWSWRWDFSDLPLVYATPDSGLRDLSLLLRNAQGDFSDVAKRLVFLACARHFVPYGGRSPNAFYYRVALRAVFPLVFLFFFGGNGSFFDLSLLALTLCFLELWFFVQNVLVLALKLSNLMHPLSSRLLTISQALRAGRPSVSFSGSQLSKRNSRHRQILIVLVREGFFSSVTLQGADRSPTLVVSFSFTGQGSPVLRRRYAVSKPSRRVYLSSTALWQSQGHQGRFLVSTPAGVLTDAEARRRNVGGEVLVGII